MSDDDPVARNRATPRRRVAGRCDLGDTVTRRLRLLTAAMLFAATAVLAAALTFAR